MNSKQAKKLRKEMREAGIPPVSRYSREVLSVSEVPAIVVITAAFKWVQVPCMFRQENARVRTEGGRHIYQQAKKVYKGLDK